MKIKSSITIPVEKTLSELNKALHASCLELLAMLGEVGEDIKLERPIALTTSKVKNDRSEVEVKTSIARYIAYVSPYEGRDESGFYLLYANKGENPISSDIYLSLESKVKVYDALKAMVRHKESIKVKHIKILD